MVVNTPVRSHLTCGLRRVAVVAVAVATTVVAAGCVVVIPSPTTTPAPATPHVPLAPICSAAASPDAVPASDPPAPVGSPDAAEGAATEQTPTGAEVEVAAMVDDELRVVAVPEEVAPAAVELLDAAGDVVAVGPVVEVHVEEAGEIESAAVATDPLRGSQWALDSIPVEPLWTCATGAGVQVAVIDTGVSGSHPDFAGRISGGVSTLGGSAVPGAGATDVHGHGTHVAGIAAAGASDGVGIAGVAPGASIVPVKVLSDSGSGSSTDVALGITWAVDNGADVLNLSLSSSSQSAAMTTAVQYAVDNGVTVFAAAGNGGTSGSVRYPAADPNTIAVAATSSSGTVASFSSRGWWVDVAAPGQSILSAIPGGWGTKSGTSMASPYLAGLAAVTLSARGPLAPMAVRDALRSTATDAGASGFDYEYGYGIANPTAAFNAL